VVIQAAAAAAADALATALVIATFNENLRSSYVKQQL